MGQKVNPVGFRLGVSKDWFSRWINRDYSEYLIMDIEMRKFIEERFGVNGAIGNLIIERPAAKNLCLEIHTAKPGIIIGRQGEQIEKLRNEIMKKFGLSSVTLRIEEIMKPEAHAKLIAESIAQQLEKRIMFRRAMKRAVVSALRVGVNGVKVCISGRLGGAEIARTEWYREGRIPLHTLRADIDYGTAIAKTTYGVIGIKVWVFKSEKLEKAKTSQ